MQLTKEQIKELAELIEQGFHDSKKYPQIKSTIDLNIPHHQTDGISQQNQDDYNRRHSYENEENNR